MDIGVCVHLSSSTWNPHILILIIASTHSFVCRPYLCVVFSYHVLRLLLSLIVIEVVAAVIVLVVAMAVFAMLVAVLLVLVLVAIMPGGSGARMVVRLPLRLQQFLQFFSHLCLLY